MHTIYLFLRNSREFHLLPVIFVLLLAPTNIMIITAMIAVMVIIDEFVSGNTRLAVSHKAFREQRSARHLREKIEADRAGYQR